jgi:phosphonate transport system substrate-binding protein
MKFIRGLILFFLFFTSCKNPSTDIEIGMVDPQKIREDTITIAILPEQNVFEQKKKYRPIAEYLSNTLNVNVKIKLLDDYGVIYDEIKNRTIDGAFFGSFNYILTKARANIEPIARLEQADGNSTYRGLIFTRKDTGLTKDVATWEGKRIALIHEVTTAGYIFPKWYLIKQGVNDFSKYFSRIIFTGSHDAAILSVFKGEADIGAAKDQIFEQVLSENPAIRKEMIILVSSMSVPSNSLCIRRDLRNDIKESLRKALLSMHNTGEGKKALEIMNAVRFRETKDSEFDELRVMANELSIDIKTYPFKYR